MKSLFFVYSGAMFTALRASPLSAVLCLFCVFVHSFNVEAGRPEAVVTAYHRRLRILSSRRRNHRHRELGSLQRPSYSPTRCRTSPPASATHWQSRLVLPGCHRRVQWGSHILFQIWVAGFTHSSNFNLLHGISRYQHEHSLQIPLFSLPLPPYDFISSSRLI